MQKIEFYKHNLTQEDKDECLKILDSLFLTTGQTVKQFEEKFSQYLGCTHTVTVSSCTDALFLALKYYNIQTGDEVITTPLSFIATANAIEYCNATPVFVDVEEHTGNINADLIEAAITEKTKAIIVVHLYGQMCDMKKIKEIADKHNLPIIEDCAHCIEGTRDNIRVGQLGDIACFSFYATKNITSGEGGALSCNDEKIYNWLLKARQHGMSKNAAERYTKRYEHYDMEFLGYKCNMTNIQAALLIHQLDHIESFLEAKERIAQLYNQGFQNNEHIKIPQVLSASKHARHLYTIWVDPLKRDTYLQDIQEAGIGIAVNFRPIHLMKYYREKYNFNDGAFEVAEKIGNSTITLPLYPKLTDEEIQYCIKTINQITQR
ncbi:MAG: DegT/DnrJ/EryC1/StrS aminotransferase family protein [bacterium]